MNRREDPPFDTPQNQAAPVTPADANPQAGHSPAPTAEPAKPAAPAQQEPGVVLLDTNIGAALRDRDNPKRETENDGKIVLLEDPIAEEKARRKKLEEEAEELRRLVAAGEAVRITNPLKSSALGVTAKDHNFGQGANDNLISLLAQPVDDIKAQAGADPAVGNEVMADSVATLGTSSKFHEGRLIGIAKVLGGIAVPMATTMATKAAITLVATAAFPAVAPLILPTVFLAWSAYKLMQSAKEIKSQLDETREGFEEQGISRTRAFAMALNQNKFKAGLLLGSAVVLALGGAGQLDHVTTAISNAIGLGGGEVVAAAAGPATTSLPSIETLTFDEMSRTPSTFFDPTGLNNGFNSGLNLDGSSQPLTFGGTDTPTLGGDVVDTTPVEIATPQDQFRAFIEGKDVSQQVRDTADRMASTNPAVAAQAAKDAAFFLINERGVEGNDALAVSLLKDAAENGNNQAKVDLAYLQYHGLSGVEADQKAAMSAMQEIKGSARATEFVQAWSGHAAPAAAPVAAAPASSFVTAPDAARVPETGGITETVEPLANSPVATSPPPAPALPQAPVMTHAERLADAASRALSSDPATSARGTADYNDLMRDKGGTTASVQTGKGFKI